VLRSRFKPATGQIKARNVTTLTIVLDSNNRHGEENNEYRVLVWKSKRNIQLKNT
jgi:hypothetical protein